MTSKTISLETALAIESTPQRMVSKDALAIVCATHLMASYPYLIALGGAFSVLVMMACFFAVVQPWCPKAIILFAHYVLLIVAIVYLLNLYDYRHPLFVNGLVLLIGWLKLSDGNPYRDVNSLLLVATVLMAESMVSGYHEPLYLACSLLFLLASLITVNNDRLRIFSTIFIVTLLRIIALSLPLLMVFYLLFPRLPDSLFPWQQHSINGWFSTQERSFEQSGQVISKATSTKKAQAKALGETLNLDQLATLGENHQTMLTAHIEGELPPLSTLYWRGGVFWKFDGITWHARPHWKRRDSSFNNKSQPVNRLSNNLHYRVQLPAHEKYWLYALELPSSQPSGTLITRDQQLISPQVLNKPVEYELTSNITSLIPASYQRDYLSSAELFMALQYPKNSNPAILQFVQKRYKNNQKPDAVVRDILSYFSQSGFRYDVDQFPSAGPNALDNFMFDSKVGQCGHYASAFVLTMRAAGIPARLVTGFRGGRLYDAKPSQNIDEALNNISNTTTLEITGMMAHAWAEYWDGYTWVRVDPTLSVPGQSANIIPATGKSYQHANDDIQGPKNTLTESFIEPFEQEISYWLDVGLYYYNTQLQQSLLELLGLSHLDLYYVQFIAVVVVIVLWLIMGWGLNKGLRVKSIDPALDCYRQLQNKLSLAGFDSAPYEGPLDYMRRACWQFPEHKERLAFICQSLMDIRYGRPVDKPSLSHIKRAIKQLKINSLD